jgi:UDP-3-O-[3-hydroxymyristoyl] glucosamine N-acyltransferase
MPSLTLADLAREIGATTVGDPQLRLSAVRSLEDAGPEHVSFYHNRRYLEQALASKAGALIVADAQPFSERNLLVVKEPYAAMARVVELLNPQQRPAPGIHESAVLGANAQVAADAWVGPHVVIGERAVVGERATIGAGSFVGADCSIGTDTQLHPHVVVEAGCRVGARCILHAGVVIGSDGFGFATVGGEHRKVPQIGIVVIEDDVELGANVCVDRATLGETRIRRGTKVDNLVQIAHNVVVGEHSLLVSQSGIAGSTHLGHHVVMAGQSGAVGHIHIADGTKVSAKTAVTEDTEPGSWITGFPARPHRQWLRAMANLFRLDELRRRLAQIEAAIEQLRRQL